MSNNARAAGARAGAHAMAAQGGRGAAATVWGREGCGSAPDVLFSDGTAVKLVGAETFRLARQYVDD
ncbi:hypothetical protein WLX55_24905, partial [Bordetella bronchiseptica]